MLVGGDLAKNAPHDLAGARLGQTRRPLKQVGSGNRADLPSHPGDELAPQFLARGLRYLQRYVRIDALPLDVVRKSDNGSFRDPRMGDQGALDLGGAEAMTGDVDDVVDPPGQPVEPVLIPPGAVAGEVQPGEMGEIGLDEPRVIAEDRAHDPRPSLRDTKISFTGTVDDLAVIVDDNRLDAKERPRRRAGFQRRRAR